mgnify:CR=1 FL=1
MVAKRQNKPKHPMVLDIGFKVFDIVQMSLNKRVCMGVLNFPNIRLLLTLTKP